LHKLDLVAVLSMAYDILLKHKEYGLFANGVIKESIK